MSRIPHFPHRQPTDDGKIVSFTYRVHFITAIFLVLVVLRGRVDPRDIVRLEGLGI
jgi:hypothetical protein